MAPKTAKMWYARFKGDCLPGALLLYQISQLYPTLEVQVSSGFVSRHTPAGTHHKKHALRHRSAMKGRGLMPCLLRLHAQLAGPVTGGYGDLSVPTSHKEMGEGGPRYLEGHNSITPVTKNNQTTVSEQLTLNFLVIRQHCSTTQLFLSEAFLTIYNTAVSMNHLWTNRLNFVHAHRENRKSEDFKTRGVWNNSGFK
jgi:hypothetical protein